MHRLVVFASLVIAGCGGVPAGHPIDASSSDHVDAASLPSSDAPVALDRNCADAKARLGTASDGDYLIDPDLDGTSSSPFHVYCSGMATASPVEYLELVHTSARSDAQPASNYSTYATGAAHATWTCDCGVITSVFTKARLDLATMTLTTEATFGVFADSTDQACLATKTGCPAKTNFVSASSCVANHDASGRANLDLRGTGFHVIGDDASTFRRYEDFTPGAGFTSEGSASVDPTRSIVELTGGGDCGGFGALQGVPIAQD